MYRLFASAKLLEPPACMVASIFFDAGALRLG
jgi:hypothetical protein